MESWQEYDAENPPDEGRGFIIWINGAMLKFFYTKQGVPCYMGTDTPLEKEIAELITHYMYYGEV